MTTPLLTTGPTSTVTHLPESPGTENAIGGKLLFTHLQGGTLVTCVKHVVMLHLFH